MALSNDRPDLVEVVNSSANAVDCRPQSQLQQWLETFRNMHLDFVVRQPDGGCAS